MSRATASEVIEHAQRHRKPLRNLFIFSFGVTLTITGIAKITSAFSKSKFLAEVDPILDVKFGYLMMGVGSLEIAIALICFFNKRQTLVPGLVAWISTSFLSYRFGLWWMNWKSPCGCLGNLTDALHISPQAADNAMKGILAYLFIGSYFFLTREWWQNRPAADRQNLTPVSKLSP